MEKEKEGGGDLSKKEPIEFRGMGEGAIKALVGEEELAKLKAKINGSSIVLIPDYTFANRVGLDNDPTGTFHKRCDIECKSIWGYIGTKRMMGERCIGCGYTVWIDPVNGGIDDKRDKETIWNATKQTEEFLNKFGIRVGEDNN